MNSTIELTRENLQEVLVQGSMDKPVLVQFWAEWSAPCKQVGAILDRLSLEMNFVLAKVDTDKSPEISSYFRITNLPDLRVFSKGQMVDMIQGAQSEAQLRKRLAKHFLSPSDLALIEAESLLQQGDPAHALEILEQLILEKPTDKKIQYSKAKALVDLGKSEDAMLILESFKEGDDFYREARSLKELMAFHQVLSQPSSGNPIETIYRNACTHALQGEYRESFSLLLDLVQTERKWNDDAARKAMLTLFGVLGPKHELTWEFRSKLNSILFI